MGWIALLLAGLLEVGWAVMLPETRDFSRLPQTAGFLVLLAGSMVGLSIATKTIPIGTAYAVWVGIGAVGTVLFGVLVSGDRTSPGQLLALGGLVVAIAAVKLTSAH
jgi:quaternary ammonium compound-resistance protein SugE